MKLLDIIKKEVQKEPIVQYNIWYFRTFMLLMFIIGIFYGKYVF